MRHQNNVFHTVFKHVPWHVFDRLVDSHGTGAGTRRLSPETSSSPRMVWRRTCRTGIMTWSPSLSGNSALKVFRLPMLLYGSPRPRPSDDLPQDALS